MIVESHIVCISGIVELRSISNNWVRSVSLYFKVNYRSNRRLLFLNDTVCFATGIEEAYSYPIEQWQVSFDT